ncbi:MAG: hypothetical protein ACLPQY_16715, partial [Streptosporangiaceae bacterium]
MASEAIWLRRHGFRLQGAIARRVILDVLMALPPAADSALARICAADGTRCAADPDVRSVPGA